jgi:hypothetical protein
MAGRAMATSRTRDRNHKARRMISHTTATIKDTTKAMTKAMIATMTMDTIVATTYNTTLSLHQPNIMMPHRT